jgi:hypothetical protein
MSNVNEEHLEKFSIVLTGILQEETALGNKVVETSEGWPEPETILVFLALPFSKTYQLPGVEFRELNDPHWWKSEYIERATHHILACKFG